MAERSPSPSEGEENASGGRLSRAIAGPAPAGLFVGLLVVTGAMTAATLDDYGLASDVVNYFRSSLSQIRWAAGVADALVSGGVGEWLDAETVLHYWRWWPARFPHPPLSRVMGALSYAALSDVVEPLVAYRGAVGASFATLVAGAGTFVHRCRESLAAGLGAALGVAAFPAVFAYGHLALPDMFLTAFWFLSVAALELHLRTKHTGWLVTASLCFGAAVATKFPGLLVGPVLGAWLLIRDAWTWRRVAALAAGAVGVFVAVNPVMWVDPVLGLSDFLGAGFGRRGGAGGAIVIDYLGTSYEYRPPWHYPFVWTAVTVPVPVWVAVGVGVIGAWRSRLALLCGVNLVVMYGALMMPAAPLHDGIRLFLPAFPFLAILAGLGVEAAREWAAERLPVGLRPRADLVSVLFLVATVGVGLVQTARYHPYQLSYFNVLVGGVEGAERAGLEVSPLKEALTLEVLASLRKQMPAKATIDPDFFMEEMCFWKQVGRIPPGWRLETRMEGRRREGPVTLVCRPETRRGIEGVRREPERADFVILPNRPGALTDAEDALWRFGGDPFFALRLEGVPLLRVYRLGN